MFNFHGPPSHLVPNRSRVSVSDTGINVNRVQPTSQEIHHHRRGGPNSNAHNNRVQGQAFGLGHDPVSLPPIAKTRSFTGARRQSSTTFSLNRSQRYQGGHPIFPPEPKKLPTQREMLFLTLTHAKPPSSSLSSSRGLTFDQLSSFLRGAFEIPKNIAWESKLRKTLSNMVSKGVVINHPGLGPHDSTFQIAETRDTGLDLSVSGKSVPKVPSWPTGLTLPNGANLICRTAQAKTNEPIMGGFQPYDLKKQQGQRQQMDSRTTTNNNNMRQQGRNPQSVKLDPMPYMPMADPMICQSFGVRAGLVNNSNRSGFEARRPNSPNTSETEGFPSEWTETEAETEGGGMSSYNVSSGVGLGPHWKPVMPTDTPPSESEASYYHIQNQNNGREINPYMRQQVKKPAPRMLDTVSHHLKSSPSPAATLLPEEEDDDDDDVDSASAKYNNIGPNESEYDSDNGNGNGNGRGINNPMEEDEEEEIEDIYINHMENDDFTGGIGTEKSKVLKLTTGSGFVHNSGSLALRSSQPAPAKGLTTNVKTLALAMGKPAQALKAKNSTSKHLKKTEALPLENFDIFADYAGETRAEYELNSRSCSIMNDIPIKRVPRTKAGDSALSSTEDFDTGGAGDSFPDNNSEIASSVKTISQSVRTCDNQSQSTAEPFDTKMDYLMGIADIIGGYDEKPLELRKSGPGTGTRTGSRSKPKPSVVPNAISTNKKFNTQA